MQDKMASFLGNPKVQYFNSSTGKPYDGGLLYSYAPGTTTPQNTYATIADALGFVTANASAIVA